jgi:C4-dicarboxylate transporter DctM subunit
MAVTRIQEMGLTPVEFLLIINVFLLIVGALMDSISAIMVIAPLLAPIAMKLGIDPIHLGIIFIVNLEIGYLTPPIGINLFVASAAFGKPMGEVMKSVVPFILLMFVGLGLVTYVPTIAMGPVNALRGEDFYEPLPKARGAPGSSGSGVTAEQGDVLAPGEGEVRSMQDITAVTDGLLSLCMVAEEIVGQEDIEPADRVVAWEKEIAGEDITDKAVLALAKAAVAKAGTSQAYAELRTEASTLVKSEWKCEALEKLLGPP